MTQTLFDFEDGTNGLPYTINTPAQGASGFSAVVANDHPAHGSLSLKIDGSGGYQYVQVNFGAPLTKAEFRGYFRTDVAVTGGEQDFFRVYSDITSSASTNLAARLYRTAANKLGFLDGAGAATAMTAALAVNTVYRWELFISCGTSGNATIKLAYYPGDSVTAIQTLSTTIATTAASMLSAHLGKQVTSAFATASGTTHEWHDDFAYDDAATTLTAWSFSPPANRAPIANAGPPQAFIEPYSTVTLDSTSSSDPDGDTITRLWAPPGGTTLSSNTAAQPTLVAPATINGVTLTIGLTVNDGALDSAAASVNIAVAAHTQWLITNTVGPVLAPAKETRL